MLALHWSAAQRGEFSLLDLPDHDAGSKEKGKRAQQTGHFAAGELMTVAAFAVCVQSVMCLPVRKLPASTCRTVHAWLIAYAQKKNRKRR